MPVRSSWLALLVAGTYFMENLDGTVIATAAPSMATSFGVLPVDLEIGISAYLLTLGICIPASGWIADRFGARGVFASAIAIFTAASVACGFATTLPMFVLVRVVQGLGGAMMVPVGRLVVLRNTPKTRLVHAIATLTWPALVAPVLGPAVGGFFVLHATWRWIFFLNIPLGLVALVVALRIVPADRAPERRPFDGLGFALASSAIALLLWALEEIGRGDVAWSRALPGVVVGIVLAILAVRHLRRTSSPLLRLDALRVPTFAATIYGGSLFRMAISAVPFLLPLMFQVGFGIDPFRSGLLVLAVFAGNLVMKPATTPVLRRFGFRTILAGNGLINVVLLLACTLLSPTLPVPIIVVILFVGGLARSMQFTAVNTLAFADVPEEQMSSANTLFNTVTQLSMGLGIALGAIGIRVGRVLAVPLGLASVPAIEHRLAFAIVAVVGILAVMDSLRLATDAGALVARGK